MHEIPNKFLIKFLIILYVKIGLCLGNSHQSFLYAFDLMTFKRWKIAEAKEYI